jgi:predicted transcriptional regulator YdeE
LLLKNVQGQKKGGIIMSEPANKLVDGLQNTEGYKPQSVPNSFKVIQGKLNHERFEHHLEEKIVTKEGFNMIALRARGSMTDFELGKMVRVAWKELQHKLATDDSCWSEKEIGYVFYSQGDMKKPDGKLELWVGVKVDLFENIPSGVERVVIPTRKYATITCYCHGSKQMNRTYEYLSDWIKREGLKPDYNKDAFSLEPNRLSSFDPFDMPADEIQDFDFDILYPIR